MQALRLQALAAALILAIGSASACPRSRAARSEFQRLRPCPANGLQKGPCPGYVVDHIVPLCAGGPDRPQNMQWQRVDDAKLKDREERQECHLDRH
mgnify:CR=1 FL=1